MGKPILRVCNFSGGKDSTAMLLRLLEEGIPVDVILFCDTGLEFPALYGHIRKVEQDIGREITVVKCPDDFEYLFAHKPINRKPRSRNAIRYGTDRDGYSWAGPKLRWCTEVLKNRPREQYLRQLRERYTVLEYIGIAADETHRINRKCNQKDGARLPLVEWGMTEADCLAYCKERGYKRIAAITLLPVNTVKAYVARHPVERADVCLQCGAPLLQMEHRKEKKFCSKECKTQWWNTHPHMMKRTAARAFVCPVCGREFQDYGERKYCSVKCYAEARRSGNG